MLMATCISRWPASSARRSRSRTISAVLGDDPHRQARLGGNLQATACQAEAPFGGLIAVGDTGHGHSLDLPARTVEEIAEEIGGVFLDDDLCLEIEAGVVAEVFVSGASKAVWAAMKTSAIRIDAISKRHIGAIVLADDAAGSFEDVLRGRMGQRLALLLVEGVEIDFAPDFREAIGRLDVGTASVGGWSFRHGKVAGAGKCIQ